MLIIKGVKEEGWAQRHREHREETAGKKGGVVHTPRVFTSKSPQAIENKGRGHEKKLQESLRVRKRKGIKEIGDEGRGR
jgi:hypothetical protein